jgi:hypothetical protein
VPINNYGNMGGQVFKGEIQILKDFLAKNQHTIRKLFNFANWCSQLPNLSVVFVGKYKFRSTFFFSIFFEIINF